MQIDKLCIEHAPVVHKIQRGTHTPGLCPLMAITSARSKPSGERTDLSTLSVYLCTFQGELNECRYSKFPGLRDQEVWPKTLVSYRVRGLVGPKGAVS